MKRQRGFTLLEVLVAFTIMATAIVGLLSGIAGAARNAAKLRDYNRVVQLAGMQMDALLVDSEGAAGGGNFDRRLTGGIEAGWQARTTITEPSPIQQPGAPSLERIELQIWWMSGQERRTFTLDAFHTHYQKVDGAGL